MSGDRPGSPGDARLRRRTLITLGIAGAAATLATAVAGAPRARAGRGPGNVVLGEGGLHHATVRTRDWAQSLRFYQDVLGFTVRVSWLEYAGTMDARLAEEQPGNQRWAYLDSGDGTCIELFEDHAFVPPADGATDPTGNPCSPIVHFALRTSRIDAVCAHARQLGAHVAGDPVDYTLRTETGQGAVVVRLFFLQGPSGEWIEMLQHAP